MSLRGTEFRDEQLVHLGSQTDLRFLDLQGARITGDTIHFKTLSGLSELRVIKLSAFGVNREGFGVSDKAMQVLGALPNLESVDLRLTRVTDAGLAELCKCKTLKTVGLAGTRVTDAGLQHLLNLPNLESLSLGVYDEGGRDYGRGA